MAGNEVDLEAAHHLGRSVLGQAKAGIPACIAINKRMMTRKQF